MDTIYNATKPDGKVSITSNLINGVRDISVIYACGVVALTILFMSGFEAGRKILSRIVWFFDGLVGGAPHTVSLPGPRGLPIVGNLLEVRLVMCLLTQLTFI